MKTLSEKDQILQKIDKIDFLINRLCKELNKVFIRIRRKNNWGFLAFDSDTYEVLEFKHETINSQISFLREYRELLFEYSHKI